MTHRSIFGDVDVLTGKHGISPSLDITVARQLEQSSEDIVVQPVLRVVQPKIARFDQVAGRPTGIDVKQLPKVCRASELSERIQIHAANVEASPPVALALLSPAVSPRQRGRQTEWSPIVERG